MRSRLVRTGASALARTWRFEARGEEHLHRLRSAGRPFIFVLWHRELLPLLWYHRGHPTALVVSRHRDGRLLADAARSWGYRILDGSSSRGGVMALRQAVRVLREGGEVAVTPDGPRGPAGSVQPGVAFAARASGAAILPVRAEADSAWETGSWDRFVIPRPGTTITIRYGAPFGVEPADRPGMAWRHREIVRIAEALG